MDGGPGNRVKTRDLIKQNQFTGVGYLRKPKNTNATQLIHFSFYFYFLSHFCFLNRSLKREKAYCYCLLGQNLKLK